MPPTAEKLRMTVLNRLSAEYPASVSLEEVRRETCLTDRDFRSAVAYLHEKALIELGDVKQGVDGVYGTARLTAAGLDYIEAKARAVRAHVIR